MPLFFFPAVLTLLALSLVACGDDDDNGGDGGNGATTNAAEGGAIDVQLTEFDVTADPASASAGDLEFAVENVGAETHEFVIVKTDLAAAELPVLEDGSFDEEGEGVEVVDEIEDIASAATANLTVSMEAGSYVLLCNLVEEEDGEAESHYAEGMHTGFSVE
jgi:hypothetical protein